MNIKNLPIPNDQALKDSNLLIEKIKAEIQSEGPITFARYMELALYAPKLGYYRSGLTKFGEGGDFVTAPLISPLFSQCLARQCHQVLTSLPKLGKILEFGAGSGDMAIEIIKELAASNCLPEKYQMLELSAELSERQKNNIKNQIPEWYERFEWISTLPTHFSGIILANEVIDAFPIHRLHLKRQEALEYYVDYVEDQLSWKMGPLSSDHLQTAIENLGLKFLEEKEEYVSEINLILPSWIQAISNCLQAGLILIIDYGFPRHEYYHPHRDQGTIMCHYQHFAHSDPLLYPGIQDITCHVDFTTIAEAAEACNLSVEGFTHQAGFLINCGLENLLSRSTNELEQYRLAQQIKRLTYPGEMGEIIKVMALTRNFSHFLLGFSNFNQIARLQ